MKLSELSATPSGSIAAPSSLPGGATTDRTYGDAGAEADLSRDELLAAYRLMLLSRRLDDKEIQLKNQSQIFFQVSGAGHEAILVAAGRQLRAREDWAFPYYRDRAFCLALGVTPYEMLLQGVGSKDDPASGGRQMPSHWGSRRLNIVSGSSPTGTQCLHGVGCAEATRRYETVAGLPPAADRHYPGEITYVSIGEGATSEGEFWETLNTASQEKLPLVILVEDNGWAISVPVAEQTPGGDVSRLLHGFPDLFIQKVDGCDYVASHRAMQQAIAYARARRGPALVHATVIRPYSHSLSDDEKLYKTPEERAREAERDPIPLLARRLQQAGHATPESLAAIASDVDREIAEAADRALVAAKPDPRTATLYVYSPNVDPAGPAFEREPSTVGRPDTMVAAINQTLKDEMARTPHMLVFGEDVADCPTDALPQVAGKGGVFKVTHGLQRAYGRERVYNSPLAEANIVGRALGLSVRGFKPVVEIQFFDYIWPAMMQIRDEVTMLRYRSNNAFACPMVIRVPIGGYLRGGAPYHSQSGESIFAHCPGLRIAYPSNAVDAAGLLRTAIRCEDPVLFLEHKHLYRQTYNKGVYPGPDYTLPFGKAAVRRPGTDLTVITWGALVQRTLLAAQQAEKDGISVRVIDLRSLMPFDWDTIAQAVHETNRVIVAHEDQLTCGFGAEIAARIGEQCFGDLDAPVTRVAALDTPVAYEPGLEEVILPQTSHVLAAIKALAKY
jgi:2-oxoisovalerate dehydrogenase E1 component